MGATRRAVTWRHVRLRRLATMEQPLLLDSALRNYVLLPITLIMVLVGVFRHNLMQLLESRPKLGTPAALRQRYVGGVGPFNTATFSRARLRCASTTP